MERLLGVENMYDADPRLARHFEQALRAHALYKRDRDYIVKDGEIVIVDEFTGRQMPGRRWSEGLHQAIEAKEGLRVQRESVTLATITFQNYFRLYDKLAGMTGTAMTEAEEFHKIYGLEVVAIPTHRPMIRDDDAGPRLPQRERPSSTRSSTRSSRCTEAGRPVLVGTVSVEKCEILSEMLKRRGIKHEVLNAKFHEKEAPIVAQAGRTGAVTIATNMAGRGTDILLGGNPAGLASRAAPQARPQPGRGGRRDATTRPSPRRRPITEEDHDRVVAAGGLHIIGTERHDARRIDNQLRGRAGRQGDPGSSRFYLSLDDDLMKRFASDRVAGLMERMGLEDDVAIESRLVSHDDRERPDPRRGLQLRHPQARRRVRRRHQQAARDDLRRARQGPPQRGPDRDGPGLPRRGDRRPRRHRTSPARTPTSGTSRACRTRCTAMGLDRRGDLGGRARGTSAAARRIADHLRELADATLEARAARSARPTGRTVERLVLLRTIDSLWVEHLTELDDMRRGIGLRGYAQQDPLNEFRREAFRLYEELRGLIRHGVATTIFRVTVTHQPPQDPSGVERVARPGRGGPRGRRTAPGRRQRRVATAAAAVGGADAGLGDPARRTGGAGRPGRDGIARRPAGRPRGRGRRERLGSERRRPPRLHADRRQDRPQRPVLVRLRRQVQEVPRRLRS